MGIKYLNKPIADTLAKSVVSCTTIASVGAGIPVGIWIDENGVRKCDISVIGSNSTNWGITNEAATASGQVIDVVISGQTAIATSDGTTGQLITDIAAGGSCTTAAVASATIDLNVCGMKSSTLTVILY